MQSRGQRTVERLSSICLRFLIRNHALICFNRVICTRFGSLGRLRPFELLLQLLLVFFLEKLLAIFIVVIKGLRDLLLLLLLGRIQTLGRFIALLPSNRGVLRLAVISLRDALCLPHDLLEPLLAQHGSQDLIIFACMCLVPFAATRCVLSGLLSVWVMYSRHLFFEDTLNVKAHFQQLQPIPSLVGLARCGGSLFVQFLLYLLM